MSLWYCKSRNKISRISVNSKEQQHCFVPNNRSEDDDDNDNDVVDESMLSFISSRKEVF